MGSVVAALAENEIRGEGVAGCMDQTRAAAWPHPALCPRDCTEKVSRPRRQGRRIQAHGPSMHTIMNLTPLEVWEEPATWYPWPGSVA